MDYEFTPDEFCHVCGDHASQCGDRLIGMSISTSICESCDQEGQFDEPAWDDPIDEVEAAGPHDPRKQSLPLFRRY